MFFNPRYIFLRTDNGRQYFANDLPNFSVITVFDIKVHVVTPHNKMEWPNEKVHTFLKLHGPLYSLVMFQILLGLSGSHGILSQLSPF